MSNAVILGGGGPVGIAWQAGLLTGLSAGGMHLANADAVIGTSAGAVTGAALALGQDLHELAVRVAEPLPLAPGQQVDLAAMQAAVTEAAAGAATPAAAMAAIGRLAARSQTAGEAKFVGRPLFAALSGRAWPASLRCTAIDIRTGELRVLDRSSEVALDAAAAASCAVPTVFPPVTLGTSRYMDGGMASPLNAHLAAGHNEVVLISCFVLTLPEGSPPALQPAGRQQLDELDALRQGGAAVRLIEPNAEFLELSGWGAHVMNVERTGDAYRAGLRQGGRGLAAV